MQPLKTACHQTRLSNLFCGPVDKKWMFQHYRFLLLLPKLFIFSLSVSSFLSVSFSLILFLSLYLPFSTFLYFFFSCAYYSPYLSSFFSFFISFVEIYFSLFLHFLSSFLYFSFKAIPPLAAGYYIYSLSEGTHSSCIYFYYPYQYVQLVSIKANKVINIHLIGIWQLYLSFQVVQVLLFFTYGTFVSGT